MTPSDSDAEKPKPKKKSIVIKGRKSGSAIETDDPSQEKKPKGSKSWKKLADKKAEQDSKSSKENPAAGPDRQTSWASDLTGLLTGKKKQKGKDDETTSKSEPENETEDPKSEETGETEVKEEKPKARTSRFKTFLEEKDEKMLKKLEEEREAKKLKKLEDEKESAARKMSILEEGRSQGGLKFISFDDPMADAVGQAKMQAKLLSLKRRSSKKAIKDEIKEIKHVQEEVEEEEHKLEELEEKLRRSAEQKLRKEVASEEEVEAKKVNATEVNDQKPANILGYYSLLSTRKQHIFNLEELLINFEPDGDLEEDKDEKDMTWLVQLSAHEDKESKKTPRNTETHAQNLAERSSWLFWLFILIGGRMPFHFVRNSDASQARVKCELRKRSFHFYVFVLTTFLLVFLTVVSTVNLFLIIMEEEVKGEPHNQIEKLLFAKNKVTALIFIFSLALASVSSLNVIFYGDSMAKYMTLWGNTLDDFTFESSSGILAATIIYIVWLILLFLFQVLLFCTQIDDAKPGPFIEGTHLLTAMVFRSFVPKVLIQLVEVPGQVVELQSSDQLWKYGIFILFLNAYALYCSRNFVIMVVLYAIGIKNLATEWNFRLRLILRQVDTKKNQHFLVNLSQSLNYKKMFEWHRKIVLLVEDNSKVFGTILVFFYLAEAFALAGECLDMAIYMVGKEKLTFSLNETAQLYDFETNSGDFMYLCFHMSQTLGIFLFVSFLLAQTGIEVMNGLIPITRHNYMNITSTNRRSFFMSLSMSFSARKPHLLGAGGVFSIDRPFILGFLAFFMYFFSVMIQTQHHRILTFPIVLQCPPGSDIFCISKKLATAEEVGNINTANEDAAKKYAVGKEKLLNASIAQFATTAIPATIKPPIPGPDPDPVSTPSPITTTKPSIKLQPPHPTGRKDECQNPLRRHSTKNENAIEKLVKINLDNIDYALCCYDYGDTDLFRECNQNSNERNLNCRRHVFQFKHLAQRLKDCAGDPDERCNAVHGCMCGKNLMFNPQSVSNQQYDCPYQRSGK